ncbi:MAG: hypothetical protein KAV82_06770 [Phycisphaerae bacterium]|nr:hypothetical protein [Phycisphaerae bacterium]
MRPSALRHKLCWGISVIIIAAAVLGDCRVVWAEYPLFVDDPGGDVRERWFAPPFSGAPVGSAEGLPDILSYTLGKWEPLDPQDSFGLFEGDWVAEGDFFRLDVVFDSLVNPPGTTGCCGHELDPFMYGPNPVFGYIEIDMDGDENTGGDLDTPQLRYLGNVGRFGGLPVEPRFADRAALDYSAFDGDIDTPPYVDRSGEEFHVAFHGWEIEQIEMSTNGDYTFDAGETWVLTGTLFHRANGYERFSYACCSGIAGSYNPVVRMQFSHATDVGQTTVSLIYPLTNAGSAAMNGDGEAEPLDNLVDNQNSVWEALNELVYSATYPTGGAEQDPNFSIIEAWEFKEASDYLDPLSWRVTLLIGGADINSNGGSPYLAWSDILPDVLPGDFDGSGSIDALDESALEEFISTHDGLPFIDADGTVNEIIDLVNFSAYFAVYDLNYDGYVDSGDNPLLPDPFDGDEDGDVDLVDFAILQRCFTGAGGGPYQPGCSAYDVDTDGDVDHEDLFEFIRVFGGPG